MVRSARAGGRRDEAPLTPPQEISEADGHSSSRRGEGGETSLNKISFGGCRQSQIPQNDSDYFPRDTAERRLFRETSCEWCDCDCTSDGIAGCLRRNRQCLFTVFTIVVTTFIILLVFRSLSYDHTGIYDEDLDRSSVKWEFHHHRHYHYNDSHGDPASGLAADGNFKRVSIPILEDSREPDYFVLVSGADSHLRLRRHSLENVLTRERMKRRKLRWRRDLRREMHSKKSMYEDVLAEINEMEKSMSDYRRGFAHTARTVFEPFTFTTEQINAYEENYIDSNRGDSELVRLDQAPQVVADHDFSEEEHDLAEHGTETNGSTWNEAPPVSPTVDSSSFESAGTYAGGSFFNFADTYVTTYTTATTSAAFPSNEDAGDTPSVAPAESETDNVGLVSTTTRGGATVAPSAYPTTDGDGPLKLDMFSKETTTDSSEHRLNTPNGIHLFGSNTFPHGKTVTQSLTSTRSVASSLGTVDEEDDEKESEADEMYADTQEMEAAHSTHDFSLTSPESSTKILSEVQHAVTDRGDAIITSLPELFASARVDGRDSSRLGGDDDDDDDDDGDDGKSKNERYENGFGTKALSGASHRLDSDVPGVATHHSNELSTGDNAIGISLAEAKMKKEEDRKRLLLNSRVVSGSSDIMFPTGPDESKPIVNAVETVKTSQQLSLTPTAFAQSFLPYQMCFYANSPHGGKPTVRESEAKTLKIEAPSFFHIPPHSFDDSKSKQTSYHFPTQQNFLSFNINNFAHSGQSPSQVPPSAGAVYSLPSPHHFAHFLNPPQPQQQPLFCTYLQPPMFHFPTVSSISEFSQPKCLDCSGEEPSSRTPHIVQDSGLSCLYGTVPCRDDSTCIPVEQWCDNKINCKDGSDEAYCSCRERLTRDRQCDGYIDCPEGEDELGCFGCPKYTFSCDTFDEPRACIPLSKRCDNQRDCPSGNDETGCTALFPEISGNETHLVSYTRGFLHRNWRGEWYPVCVDVHMNLWASEACMEETGSFTGEPHVSFAQVAGHFKGPFIVRTEDGRVRLQDHCKGHVSTWVRCSEMQCGTRVTSEVYTRTRFKRYFQARKEEFERWWKRAKKEIMSAYNVDDVYWKVSEVEEAEGRKLKREESGRVVGGKESEPRAWPWIVALYKDGDFHCGGVVLDENWIVTAAHCVDRYWKHYYEVRCGMLRRFSFSPMEQVRHVSDVVAHERYNKSIMNNDIALLRVNRPLNFNRWVRPVCLPSYGEADALGPTPGTKCIAIGWGAVKEHGSNPDQMREVEIPILPRCRHVEDLAGDEICAGIAEGGKDTCQGDSGGPLLCRDTKSAWYVAGIVSHGEGCARPGEPGAYTRVSLFIDWIAANTNDLQLPTKKPAMKCPGFRCRSGSRRCISHEWVCNGITDCLNGEDEIHCPNVDTFVARTARYKGRQDEDNDDDVNDDDDDDDDGDSSKKKKKKKKVIFARTLLQTGDKGVSGSALYSEESVLKKNSNSTRSLKRVAEITSYIVHTVREEYGDAVHTETTKTYQKTEGYVPEVTTETTRDSPSTPSTDDGVNAAPVTALDGATEGGDETPLEEVDRGRILLTDGYNVTDDTRQDTFQCRYIIQTVPATSRCDRIIDCEDFTDETLCTCADRLTATRPESVCDGQADCADLTDEVACHACSRSEFHCKMSDACLPLSKRCDDVRDCAHGEDEEDCYALTTSKRVSVDGDGKPAYRMAGMLMKRRADTWSPVCGNEDVAALAAKVCASFGSSGCDKYENGTDALPGCISVNVSCSRRLNNDLEYYTTRRGSYRWPWFAFVYVDGDLRCSATLLERDWLITDRHCVDDVSLEQNHLVAKLGAESSESNGVVGFGVETLRIDGVKLVSDSDIILLHLSSRVRVTWRIRPISVPFWFDVSARKETCVAADEESVFLESVPNCAGRDRRCYTRIRNTSDCDHAHRRKRLTGVVACQSHIGWYPASVYHERHGFCEAERYVHVNLLERMRDIKYAIGEGVRASRQVDCDGIRCREGACIPWSKVCDATFDCPTFEDEDSEWCTRKKQRSKGCGFDEVRCANGGCIRKVLFGNGVENCGDGSDESVTCRKYLELSKPDRVCDGVVNCFDKSDEDPMLCPCSPSKFSCSESGNVCIPTDFVCDGADDCPKGEDEAACVGFKRSDPHSSEVEIIHMSYGVWHSLCSPTITEEQANETCRELGFDKAVDAYKRNRTRIHPVLDPFSVVKLNARTSVLLRSDRAFVGTKEDGTCEVVVVRCE